MNPRNEMLIRRIAGTFVLVSLALGWWVHPAWFLFTTFVGLNLFQSSFTGFCPMDNILTHLRKRTALSGGSSTA